MQFLNGVGGPPPFAPVGGMNGLDAGVTGYAEVNLRPGQVRRHLQHPQPQGGRAAALRDGHGQGVHRGAVRCRLPHREVGVRADSQPGLQFNTDGTFTALDGTTQLAEATYSFKGDVFTEESNNQGCPTLKHYRFTFDGVNLKFSPMEDPTTDPCDEQRAISTRP